MLDTVKIVFFLLEYLVLQEACIYAVNAQALAFIFNTVLSRSNSYASRQDIVYGLVQMLDPLLLKILISCLRWHRWNTKFRGLVIFFVV